MPVWEILAAFWHKIMLAAFLETPWTLIFNLPQKQYISQKHAMLCCVLDIASLFMLTPTIPCKFFLLCTWKVFVTSSQVRHRSLVRRKIKLKGGKRLKRETRSPPSLRRRTTSHQNPLHDQDSHHRAHQTKLSREVCAAVGFQDVCAMARAARRRLWWSPNNNYCSWRFLSASIWKSRSCGMVCVLL